MTDDKLIHEIMENIRTLLEINDQMQCTLKRMSGNLNTQGGSIVDLGFEPVGPIASDTNDDHSTRCQLLDLTSTQHPDSQSVLVNFNGIAYPIFSYSDVRIELSDGHTDTDLKFARFIEANSNRGIPQTTRADFTCQNVEFRADRFVKNFGFYPGSIFVNMPFTSIFDPMATALHESRNLFFSGKQAEFEMERNDNGVIEINTTILSQIIAPVIKEIYNEVGEIDSISKSFTDEPNGNEQMAQLQIELHQNPEYKQQGLNSALALIKETVNLTVIDPFNKPAYLIALELPDYFDSIKNGSHTVSTVEARSVVALIHNITLHGIRSIFVPETTIQHRQFNSSVRLFVGLLLHIDVDLHETDAVFDTGQNYIVQPDFPRDVKRFEFICDDSFGEVGMALGNDSQVSKPAHALLDHFSLLTCGGWRCPRFFLRDVLDFTRLYDIRRYTYNASTVVGKPHDHFCPEHLFDDANVGITGVTFSDQNTLLVSHNEEFVYPFSRNMGRGSNIHSVVDAPHMTVHYDSDMETDSKPSPHVFTGHMYYLIVKGVGFIGANGYIASGGCGWILSISGATTKHNRPHLIRFTIHIYYGRLITIAYIYSKLSLIDLDERENRGLEDINGDWLTYRLHVMQLLYVLEDFLASLTYKENVFNDNSRITRFLADSIGGGFKTNLIAQLGHTLIQFAALYGHKPPTIVFFPNPWNITWQPNPTNDFIIINMATSGQGTGGPFGLFELSCLNRSTKQAIDTSFLGLQRLLQPETLGNLYHLEDKVNLKGGSNVMNHISPPWAQLSSPFKEPINIAGLLFVKGNHRRI